MALITVSGETGCRTEEVARITASSLGWELITDARLRRLIGEEFENAEEIPDKAYRSVVLSILARLASEHHIVTTAEGSELLLPTQFPGLFRVRLVAPEAWRVGAVMLETRTDRAAARKLLTERESENRAARRSRFGRATIRPDDSDLVLNTATLESERIARMLCEAAQLLNLPEHGLLSSGAEAQLQFRVRLELAKHGMTSTRTVSLKRAPFVHPSEEIFANLLDFYRIAWEYEPRSFPIAWDKNGKVLEAFTPDFYLPEFDLFLELTTMKQAHVTKKNRKIKLLRQIYPDVNIQIFYQKDFENLIFKYGIAERAANPSREAVKA